MAAARLVAFVRVAAVIRWVFLLRFLFCTVEYAALSAPPDVHRCAVFLYGALIG